VTTSASSGPGSLSQAISDANANPGHDTINFAIGTGMAVIPITALGITEEVTIDGRTQPGYSGDPLIVLDGNDGPFCIDVGATAGTFTEIRALAIRDCASAAIRAFSPIRLHGSWIGAAGAEQNSRGLTIYPGASGSLIGGTTAAERNVISGNDVGIDLQPAASSNVSDVTISGNYIGIDPSGTAALPNVFGITAFDAQRLTIGGTAAGARNVISGNVRGVVVSGSAIVIAGNYIGTAPSGLSSIPNGEGVSAVSGILTTGILIGGTDPAARNVISGNDDVGIGTSTRNVAILNNYIGVDATGAAALPNRYAGVFAGNGSQNVDVGASGAGNVISGTAIRGSGGGGYGVVVSLAISDVRVRGNLIGLDAAGMNPIPNTNSGVHIVGTPGVIVGGLNAGEGNRIEHNGWYGVETGTLFSSTIGARIEGNSIRDNAAAGIAVIGASTTGTIISRNSVDGNGGLGIDLAADGVTANDSLDPDTGPNQLQNFPQLTAPASSGPTAIAGTLNSTPLTQFTIEFFSSPAADPAGFGEGATYLGSTMVTTDPAGNASFTFVVPVTVAAGEVLSATATGPSGTSEFSAAIAIVSAAAVSIPVTSMTGLLLLMAGLIAASIVALNRP
jgi:hypothetical protein